MKKREYILRLFRPSMRMYFVFLVIFVLAALFTGQFILAAAEAVVVALLAWYSGYSNKKRKRQVIEYIEAAAYNLEGASKGMLRDMPFPMVIFNINNGRILWNNENFLNITGGRDHFFEIGIGEMVPGFKYRWLTEGKHSAPEYVRIGERIYNVYGNAVKMDERNGGHVYWGVLYWLDVTDYVVMERKYKDTRPVVAVMMLDNYDELFKNVKESDSAVAMATIDDAISKWTQGTTRILRKIEKNKYFLIFENRYLKDFTKERFSILDTVRELPMMGSIPPTLSIGVGADKSSLAESEEAARNSLDMALSRGGDQAVVSKETGFEFFGGYAKGNDRRAKITSRVLASSFAELLNSVKTVIVMGHQYSDMDSLGACVGIACIGKSFGKKTHILLNSETNLAEPLYDRLIDSKLYDDIFISKQDAMMTVDLDTLLVIVDTHRASYTEMPELIPYAGKVAVIDHHRKSADFIKDTSFFFHDPYASSACEMVTELIEYLEKCKLSALESDALLAGIYLDTKNFALKTGTCTFEASAYLRNMGASTVNVKLMFQTDVDTYKLKAELIKKS